MRSLSKYLADPAMIPRKLHWSWLRRNRRAAEVTVDAWNGRLTFNVADGLIGKRLFVRRAFERDFVERGCRFLAEHDRMAGSRDVMLDIGANIGMIALATIKHGYFREAIAVEPSPDNYRLLATNVSQNGCGQVVHTRQLALSAEAGHLRLTVGAENSGGHAVIGLGAANEVSGDSVEVEATTLDDLLHSEFPELIERIGLAWVDIEGHEAKFFAGADLLRERSIPVVCEFFPRLSEQYGTPRDEYLDVVSARFRSFAVLDAAQPVVRGMDELAVLYDEQRRARDAINLMLLH